MSKLKLPHVGMRTVKTAVAVTLSYLIFAVPGLLYNESYPGVLAYVGPLYACIASIVCMQGSIEQTLQSGRSRFLGVLIGGILGILLLAAELFFHHWALTALALGLVCIAGIWICMLFKWPSACAMACIVPCVMAIAANVSGVQRYYYAIARVAETMTGVGVATLVNAVLPARLPEAPGAAPGAREISMELGQAKDSGLHDFELVSLHVDYRRGEAEMFLKPPQGEERRRLSVQRLRTFSVSRELPWGEGIYVCSSGLERISERTYQLELELNSGDRVTVRYDETG